MDDPQKPSRARYWVVVFISLLAFILYVDRVCIAKAQKNIQGEFRLTDAQFGYVCGAFTLAYALFEIPGGWLGDRFGPRKVLMRIVVWWSVFTAATGWTVGFVSLLVTRFLFGAGEAGCFPNSAKTYSIWLPADERNRAQSFLWIKYFCFSWVWYFYITWLPRFVDDRFHGQMSPALTSLITGLPLFLGGLGSFFCGFLSKGAAQVFGSVARSRRMLAGGGFLL